MFFGGYPYSVGGVTAGASPAFGGYIAPGFAW